MKKWILCNACECRLRRAASLGAGMQCLTNWACVWFAVCVCVFNHVCPSPIGSHQWACAYVCVGFSVVTVGARWQTGRREGGLANGAAGRQSFRCVIKARWDGKDASGHKWGEFHASGWGVCVCVEFCLDELEECPGRSWQGKKELLSSHVSQRS